MEYIALGMFVVVCFVLLLGFPVAFSLAGTALIFAGIGAGLGIFDFTYLTALPNRLFGIVNNQTLLAVPLFVFMGAMLERSKIAENLLNAMSILFGRFNGGLGIAVTLVGMLLAASTGIVGATVVTMGLLSLPTMLKRGYNQEFSTGIICATGTLGQIIPPSIALVLLGDVLSSAYQKAQLSMGIFSPETVSVGDLFAGAVIPGMILVFMYLAYCLIYATFKPESVPKLSQEDIDKIAQGRSVSKLMLSALVPPLALIIAVLGSILFGFATPTEAAGVGAMGALVLALLQKQLTKENLKAVMDSTVKISSMVFMILIGASLFSLVFRGYGGEELVQGFFEQMPGGVLGATILVMP